MRLPNDPATGPTPARGPLASAALIAPCALALTLGACGSTHIAADADAAADGRGATTPSSSASAVAVNRAARVAQRAYKRETRGSKLHHETERIARDPILLRALARGDVRGARADARAQLLSGANHLNHVTRISVVRGAHVVVNATLNSDGRFVVAPAVRALAVRGRSVGTLLVSIQDVTGFVKLVHRRTRADVVARGSSGQVRTSLPAAAHAALPPSGSATIAGRSYAVRSFRELGWGGEALTVWVLEPA
jgi:hypothetical protein